jgi:sigma-E factor negative regulatory protein RseB
MRRTSLIPRPGPNGAAQEGRPPAPGELCGSWAAGGLTIALSLLWSLGAVGAVGVVGAGRPDSDPEALRLLGGAAGAARSTAYEGVQVSTSWHAGHAATAQARVSHVFGTGTFVRGSSMDRTAVTRRPGAVEPYGGLAGFTPALLDLLTRNYSVVRAKDGSICGRSAHVVEARRPDGSASGRFWIDSDTGLMLYREVLDQKGRAANITGFGTLRVLRSGNDDTSPGSAPAAAPAGRPLATAELNDLRHHGWTLPQSLPGNLILREARRTGTVVHLSYSDGLSAVSVFVQPGALDERRFAHWHRVSRGGRAVFEHATLQRWAVWASRGYVYTVLADSPEGTSDGVVGALPHGSPGFWERLARGFGRLNPFG